MPDMALGEKYINVFKSTKLAVEKIQTLELFFWFVFSQSLLHDTNYTC